MSGVTFTVTGVAATIANLESLLDLNGYKAEFENFTQNLYDEIVLATPISEERMKPNWTYEMDGDRLNCTIANRGLYWAEMIVYGSPLYIRSIFRGTDTRGTPYMYSNWGANGPMLEDVDTIVKLFVNDFMDTVNP